MMRENIKSTQYFILILFNRFTKSSSEQDDFFLVEVMLAPENLIACSTSPRN